MSSVRRSKPGAAGVDAESVAALLRSLVALQGEDYVASPPPDAFAKVDARIGLELGTGPAGNGGATKKARSTGATRRRH